MTQDLPHTNNYEAYNNSGSNGIPCDSSYIKVFRQSFLPTLYSIIFIVGFIGNGLVLCVLLKHQRRSNMLDVCLFNLGLSDLLFLISLPFWAHYAATGEWIFGIFMCHAVTAFYILGFYGSIFFMMLMTVDRYVVTVHAQTTLYFRCRSSKVYIALVFLMWVLSLLASLPDIIMKNNVTNVTNWTCEANYHDGHLWRKFSYIELNFLGLVLPLFVMGFCYSQIIPILITMNSQQKHKAIKLILVLIVIFFLCWIPYNVVVFLYFLVYTDLYNITNSEWCHLNIAMQWTETITFIHCCLNPIIYAIVGQRFRTLMAKTLSEWFAICFGWCKPQTDKRGSMFSTRSSMMTNTTVL
ncbi:C-C chemokine receptor type 5-like isoform X2 [Hoplias malabaricus]|uniref:C-C chemokine receptor type 5-like isoform X2 n=1 Tax=Hoplias malabaricus TaxID=27720 RepID=UPI003461DCAB